MWMPEDYQTLDWNALLDRSCNAWLDGQLVEHYWPT
jgi:hypothetical protein